MKSALLLLGLLTLEDTNHLTSKAESQFDQGHVLSLEDPELAGKAFKDSAELFTLLSTSADIDQARVHYNAGNAWYYAGELGHAIFHLRKAERAAPMNITIRQNLAFARSQTLDAFEEKPADLTISRHLSISTTAWLFGLTHLAAWGLYAARRFGKKGRGLYMITVLTILFGLLTFYQIMAPKFRNDGVILAREVMPRMGNNDAYQPAFSMPLHAGTEFELIEIRNDWIHAAFVTGDTGWLPANTVGLIDGPSG